MANYKNGIETKSALYNSSKKLFYTTGYDETTIKDIVSDADSKLGLFTYYFEGKESVAMEIFKDFVNDIALALDSPLSKYIKKDEDDYFLMDMIEYRAYFLCINANPHIRRFYKEISLLRSFPEVTIGLKDYFIQDRFETGLKFETNVMMKDEAYYRAIASLTSGMEIQFFRDVINNKIDINYEDAIDIFLTEYYRFLVLDKNLTQEKLRQSRKMINMFDFYIEPYFTIKINEK